MFRSINVPIWLVGLLALSSYTVWEAYWYTQVGLNFIKWHTHFMPLIVLWFALSLLITHFYYKPKLLVATSSVFFSLILSEAVLMFTGYTKSYIENRNGFYQSLLNQHSTDSTWAYPSGSKHRLTTPEYDYERTSNKYGFSDFEFSDAGSKLLIQTYGDSFTEGDGAPFDSSYPAILRTLLGDDFVVQNYGICGNDPGFYVIQLDKIGARFKPDIIVMCYGTGDFLHDVMSRGGLERFTQTGWQTRKGPWYEVIYAMSYVSRLFFHAAGVHYNNFFMSATEKARQLKLLEPKWNEMFVEIARLAQRYNTKILLFKKPERSEIDLNEYQYDMAFFDSLIVKYQVFHHADLLPAYRNIMNIENGGSTADYYWKKDGHHNPKGYVVMAQVVKDALRKKELITLTSSAN